MWDRAKPGIIAVNDAGRRFVDESVSYHRFTRATYESHASVPTIPAWLVTDARALASYGLGMIHPHTPRPLLKQHIASGYLRSGRTLHDDRHRSGPPWPRPHCRGRQPTRPNRKGPGIRQRPTRLRASVRRPRPSTERQPRPDGTSAFYAVAVVPTPLATSLGLRVGPEAQVIGEHGQPVPGLYACGNDANSAMGPEYPGAGCQIGAGLTFGYLAARHAARTASRRG
ncbi:FAD-binding protein [Streptomyces sp. NPDC005773]|uniref:FAD-binding protein n=1 Tax=Streptomyces sp. NPDC005773 TaxID=3364727 RepID=UPI0036CA2DBC